MWVLVFLQLAVQNPIQFLKDRQEMLVMLTAP